MPTAKDHSTPTPPRTSGIYQIRNLLDGKVYVGSAVNFRRRWGDHRRRLRDKVHHNLHLQNAWDKYGSGNFVFEILETVEDENDLIPKEQEWLDRLRPFDRTIGYNNSPTAYSCRGCKHTEETRAKVSASLRGKKLSADHVARAVAGRRGYRHSPETLAKLSMSNKGKHRKGEPVPPDQLARMIEAQRKRRREERMRRADQQHGVQLRLPFTE